MPDIYDKYFTLREKGTNTQMLKKLLPQIKDENLKQQAEEALNSRDPNQIKTVLDTVNKTNQENSNNLVQQNQNINKMLDTLEKQLQSVKTGQAFNVVQFSRQWNFLKKMYPGIITMIDQTPYNSSEIEKIIKKLSKV